MVLLIGILFIVAIVLAVVAFVPLKSFEHNATESVTATGGAETLTLSVVVDVCNVKIVFEEMDGKDVQVDLNIDGRSGYLSNEPDIIFTVDHDQVGQALSVDVVLDMESGFSFSYEDALCLVTIDPSLRTAVDVKVDVGDASLHANSPVELDVGKLDVNVGSVRVELGTGVSLHGDLDLRSKVGSVNMECRSLTLGEDIEVGLTVSTGSISLYAMQTIDPGANMTFNCNVDVGSIKVNLDLTGDIAGEISSSTGVGDISTDITGFSGLETHLVSDNFPGERNFTLNLMSDVGAIEIDASWSG